MASKHDVFQDRHVVKKLHQLKGTGDPLPGNKVGREALEACKGEMRRSIASMQALLDDPARNLARIERFPQIEDREACRRCPFRRPCGRL